MNVTAIASRPRTSTGPPFERLYAVEPEGVEQIIPSQGTTPRSSPPTAHESSTIRPSVELVATTSFTATCRSPASSSCNVGSSTIAYSATARTRSTPWPTSFGPCVTTAAVLTGRDRCVDSLVEVIWKRRVAGLREVEEELPVPLRSGEPGVYDVDDRRPPSERGVC